MDLKIENALGMYSAQTHAELTEEQKFLASDFTVPTVSFSDPGTGKTHTAIAGLVMAQTYHRVPGKKINAMSFTRAATNEFKNKYDRVCKKIGISPTVNFNTFHSICFSILREAYPKMTIRSGIDFENDLPQIARYLCDNGYDTDDMFYARKVLDAINSLNSSLAFDKDHVSSSFKFKKLGLDLEIFQNVRRSWFISGVVRQCITQGDIPIYALYCLLTNEVLQRKYKEMYKIMVVDEFQDLSLLHLKILSLVSDNLVVIGDLKQQIYAFNGSSQQIVEEFFKMYPEARIAPLTHSFRCKQEIADFATAIVEPNFDDLEPFVGVGTGGEVDIKKFMDLDLKSVIAEVAREQKKIGMTSFKDTFFLVRNNFSAVPIAEELYQQGVFFRMGRFSKVMDMDIFKELTILGKAAASPKDSKLVEDAMNLLPEFKQYIRGKNPLAEVMEKTNKSLFDVPYRFKEEKTTVAVNRIKQASIDIEQGKTTDVIFARLLPIYEELIIEGNWWKLEMEKEFYFDLAQPIISKKTFGLFLSEEYDKEGRISDCTKTNVGIRVYTTHSAKGLEADEVYILDAEEGIFPSNKAFKRYKDADCEFEAAKDLRNERNLLFVAATRAMNKLVICYKDKLTPLLASPKANTYSYLDFIYNDEKKEYDDVNEFMRLMKLDN